MTQAATIHAQIQNTRPFRIGQRVASKGVLMGTFTHYADYKDGVPIAGIVAFNDGRRRAVKIPLCDLAAYTEPEVTYEQPALAFASA